MKENRGYTVTAANDIPWMLDEIERYRRALAHIADTCIQDPDTAQFAARVLDGKSVDERVAALLAMFTKEKP